MTGDFDIAPAARLGPGCAESNRAKSMFALRSKDTQRIDNRANEAFLVATMGSNSRMPPYRSTGRSKNGSEVAAFRQRKTNDLIAPHLLVIIPKVSISGTSICSKSAQPHQQLTEDPASILLECAFPGLTNPSVRLYKPI